MQDARRNLIGLREAIEKGEKPDYDYTFGGQFTFKNDFALQLTLKLVLQGLDDHGQGLYDGLKFLDKVFFDVLKVTSDPNTCKHSLFLKIISDPQYLKSFFQQFADDEDLKIDDKRSYMDDPDDPTGEEDKYYLTQRQLLAE